MANKPKPQDRDRRAKVEAMRREQQARERRKTLMFIGVSVVVGLGLVAAAAVPAYLNSKNDPKNKELKEFGVAASAASCGKMLNDDATGVGKHVKEGTNVDYDQVPPSSGPHWPTPAFPARNFYTARDRPKTEQLVHNLEHGYTILWYDKTVTGKKLDAIRDLAGRAAEAGPAGPGNKFIAVAWDNADGKFPAGKHVALSHWGAKESHRQLCGQLSGAVVSGFMTKFPYSDSPEPNAA